MQALRRRANVEEGVGPSVAPNGIRRSGQATDG
jgi:hypothetical protein